MTCFPRLIKSTWYVAWEFRGSQFTASLKTGNRRDAELRIAPIRDCLYRLETGQLEIPSGVKPRDFILAGGRVAAPKPPDSPTADALKGLYLAAKTDVETNSLRTIGVHLGHFVRIVGAARLDAVTVRDAMRYAETRLAEKHGGNPIQPYTVRKELRTIRQALDWAARRFDLAIPAWEVKDVRLPKTRGREPFRTWDQIKALVDAGAVDADDAWETLYLTGPEIAEVLDHVRAQAHIEPWIYPMVAFVALTGARRSEMMRSRAEDWDLKAGVIRVREKKRDTTVDLTFREIDVHPRLAEAMRAWIAIRPPSPFMISIDGAKLDPDRASNGLDRALRGHPKWSKIRGFHAFRHSVASILASEGVDQRYIDRILGHQTEAMRKRYTHLLPRGVSRAIAILLGPGPGAAHGPDTAPLPPD